MFYLVGLYVCVCVSMHCMHVCWQKKMLWTISLNVWEPLLKSHWVIKQTVWFLYLVLNCQCWVWYFTESILKLSDIIEMQNWINTPIELFGAIKGYVPCLRVHWRQLKDKPLKGLNLQPFICKSQILYHYINPGLLLTKTRPFILAIFYTQLAQYAASVSPPFVDYVYTVQKYKSDPRPPTLKT